MPSPYPIRRRGFALVLACVLGAAALASATPPERPAIKIFLSEPGVYRVAHEELAAAGWPAAPVATGELVLSNRGAIVPLAVEDGGDGLFGPGDGIVFVGDRLPGENSYYNEFSSLNVYRLALARGGSGRGFRTLATPPLAGAGGAGTGPAHWLRRQRFEQDAILLRYPGKGQGEEELWYWARLTHIDKKPFGVDVDLADLDVAAAAPVALRVQFRGWSRPANKASAETKDHSVELTWNGTPVARADWNGSDAPHTVEIAALPAAALRRGGNRLEVRVPSRPLATGGEAIVDVVVLNWIEVTSPRGDAPPAAALRLERAPGAAAPRLALAAGGRLELFGEDGVRTTLTAGPAAAAFAVPVAAAAAPVWVVPADGFRSARGLEPDVPSAWRQPVRRADYLIVAHPTLLDAVRPLAEHHRRRGLEVALVDVRDVYDEFAAGIAGPRPLREFVAYAAREWAKPAPRFVLFVGDASWDGKNEKTTDRQSPDWVGKTDRNARFMKNASDAYSGLDGRNVRNLVPTWDYGSLEGHAASDNAFADLDGDGLPELAVGRFPVATPEEVAAIVAKTVGYANAPPAGDWRHRVLWVTNEEEHIRRWSDQLAERLDGRGLDPVKVYPAQDLEAGAGDQARLRAAFDDGAAIVHFMGHGGRYIWRTGPPDLATQRDLFGFADVEQLAATGKLPFVVSMTCYSAPFDHPSADSIGEKLLREPARGAVAVLAASWRNYPTDQQSRAVLDELVAGGTVGEAIVRAKRALNQRDFAQQYNLLGDPALVLALPGEVVAAGRAALRSEGASR